MPFISENFLNKERSLCTMASFLYKRFICKYQTPISIVLNIPQGLRNTSTFLIGGLNHVFLPKIAFKVGRIAPENP